jgi:hypothetical protein
MLGMDNIGALATFEGATDFHAMMLNAVADIISETFSKYAIPRLFELNGLDPDGYALHHSPAGDMDLPAFADFLQKAGAFLTWTAADQADLRSRSHMIDISIEELERLEEEERERAEANLAMMQQQPQPDQQSADLFDVAGNAPDDDERRKLERKWYRTALGYWQGQFQRVVRGVSRARS